MSTPHLVRTRTSEAELPNHLPVDSTKQPLRPQQSATASLRRLWRVNSARIDLGLAMSMGLVAALGRADLWLLLAVVLLSRMLGGPRHSALACLPAATLLVSAGLVAVLTSAGLFGLQLLSSTAQIRLLLCGLSLAAVAAILRRPVAPVRTAHPSELIACLPGGIVLLLGAFLSRLPLRDAVGGLLLGWDNGAHVLYSAEIAHSGELDYEARSYPRGLHALIALVVTARGPLALTPDSLERLMRTQSFAVWVLFGLLSCTVALATLRLATLRSLPGAVGTATAVCAGLATLSPFFFSFTMQYGFETTIAVALVLAIASLELLQRRAQPTTVLVVAAAAATTTAHTYQVLLPVVALPLLVAAIRLLQRRPGGWQVACSIALVLLLTALPPIWGVVTQTGVAAVAIPGAAAGLPVFFLVTGVLATVWLATGGRRRVQVLAMMVLVVVAIALGSAWWSGASLASYYPRKMLWHAALLSLPMLSVATAAVLLGFTHRTRRIPFVRILGGAVAGFTAVVLVVLAVPGPYMAVSGGWTVPGDVVGVLMHPEDEQRVCSLDSEFARQVGFRMLSYYGGPEPVQGALPSCPQGPDKP